MNCVRRQRVWILSCSSTSSTMWLVSHCLCLCVCLSVYCHLCQQNPNQHRMTTNENETFFLFFFSASKHPTLTTCAMCVFEGTIALCSHEDDGIHVGLRHIHPFIPSCMLSWSVGAVDCAEDEGENKCARVFNLFVRSFIQLNRSLSSSIK